jgi:uncharacterized membrane protein HdeD (DUF308 family)
LKLPEFPWFLFLLLGVLCTILGIAGIVNLSLTFTLGAYSVLFFGILFLINGISHILSGIFTRPLSSGILEILCGILYVLAGIFVITEPFLAAGIYTLILAISLIASGAVRVMMAFLHRRFGAWLVVVLGGVLTMVVGIYILSRWPWDSVWVIGLFFAIDLFMQGISWIALGVNLRAAVVAERAGVPTEVKISAKDTQSS